MPECEIEIWSDYVCPFCCLVTPAVARAQRGFGGKLRVTWRAFELRPEPLPSLDEDRERYRGLFARGIGPRARDLGLVMHFPPKHPRTRLAHRLAAHARGQRRADDVHLALHRALWERGEDIGDMEVLAAIASGTGLDPAVTRAALLDPELDALVLADESLAAELGLDGVPAILVRAAGAPLEASRFLHGLQPTGSLERAVEETLG